MHEINNTSGLISANIEALKNEIGLENESVMDKLDLIEDCSRQAVDFANELLGFSASRNKNKANYKINNLIDIAISQIKPYLEERIKNFKNIKIKKNDITSDIICSLYEMSLIQIVRNIILNAYQAMEEKGGGVLNIVTESDDSEGYAILQFKDTGCGIPEEIIPKIFEPEFTTKEKGNGLGLWLAKMHLDRIGGSISVKSEVNKMTVFTIKIPLIKKILEG